MQGLGPNGPGAISNASLKAIIKEQGLDSLTAGQDYAVVSKDVWQKLKMWYGAGPPLEAVWHAAKSITSPDQLLLSMRIIEVQVRMPDTIRTAESYRNLKLDVLVSCLFDVLHGLDCHPLPGLLWRCS